MGMEQKTKIMFLGTPEFARPTLEKLVQGGFGPDLVVCAPDKPTGRTQILTPPPVKTAAQKLGLKIFQTEKKEELEKLVLEEKPDLIICAAFSLILTPSILAEPRLDCLNIHPSLLPRWRGASPLQSAILAGDKKTGVTIIKMTEKIDAGPIVAQKEVEINDKISTPELSLILAHEGADLLLKILPDWIEEKIEPKPQNENEATFSLIIKKEDGKIDWSKSAAEIERQIRAFHPWPGSFSKIAGRKIKIMEAGIEEREEPLKKIGEIFLNKNGQLCVKTKKGSFIPKIVQAEGNKEMEAADFLRGHKEIIGQILN